jgi:AcrR family transcriptional regulator
MNVPSGGGVVRGDDKKERILDAALALFAERGFHGTAVPEIADAAGVGAGTIYRYFESKEAIVNALYQHWKGQALVRIFQDFPAAGTVKDKAIGMFTGWAWFVVENPTAAAFLELHHHAAYLDETSCMLEKQGMGSVQGLIAEARTAGAIREDVPAELLIALVQGMMTGLVRAHFEERLVLDAELIGGAARCCWEMVRA